MLFEQELQNNSVPEWRAKYLDYKSAKKKIKACEQALRKANQTPRFPINTSRGAQTPATATSAVASTSIEEQRRRIAAGALTDAKHTLQKVSSRTSPKQSENQPLRKATTNTSWGKSGGAYGSLETGSHVEQDEESIHIRPPFGQASSSMSNPETQLPTSFSTAHQPQAGSSPEARKETMWLPSARTPPLDLPGPAMSSPLRFTNTGSISDPMTAQSTSAGSKGAPSLKLPEAELDDEQQLTRKYTAHRPQLNLDASRLRNEKRDRAIEVRRAFTSPYIKPERNVSAFKRFFSRTDTGPLSAMELPTEARADLANKQRDFFDFLDAQLEMVEEFYGQKEKEAKARMEALTEQLELLKEHQAREADAAAFDRRTRRYRLSLGLPVSSNPPGHKKSASHKIKDTIVDNLPFRPDIPIDRKYTSESVHNPLSEQISKSTTNALQDYTRRTNENVSYREAKSKLKHALQEFYRNLDILKAYAMLNKEAFRKIVKKYDKSMSAREAPKFMSEKVNNKSFAKSDEVYELIANVENQYAYFEKGSHKVAATKLRAKHNVDYSPSSFRNGLCLGLGSALGVRGLVFASDIFYNSPNPVVVTETSYLLQLYGGYFLVLFLVLAFCVDCRIWQRNHVNYVFIFEFDPRNSLDWRQLAEIPCLLYMIFGLTMWLNFSESGGGVDGRLWRYYPVILAGFTVFILFFPFQHLYYYVPRIRHGKLGLQQRRIGFLYPHSRAWFAFSNFRLYTGGLYPVEFRDFFLGDLYCSLTYVMGNLELFFCLYVNNWNNPPQCNSSNSMLFGFFTALPGIWRALQCVRRYRDTGDAFPHLYNFTKYLCTILFYVTLSLYRLDETIERKIVFVIFAVTNSVYTSVWDISYDWSLGVQSERSLYYAAKGQRQHLTFPTWYYYPAVIVDPILRFNWVLYIIPPLIWGELQHSSLISFFVALSELFRRSFWALFRVENDQATNNQSFKVTRNLPLPYKVRPDSSGSGVDQSLAEAQSLPASTPKRALTAIGKGHAMDFERRKPRIIADDSSDEEDDIASEAEGPS